MKHKNLFRNGLAPIVCFVIALYVSEVGFVVAQAPDPIVIYEYGGRSTDYSFEVKIYSNRTALFVGKKNTKIIGTREFQVSAEQYRAVVEAFALAGFESLAASYGGTLVLGQRAAITSNLSGVKKTVILGAPDGVPKALFELMWKFEEILEIDQLACPAMTRIDSAASFDGCAERKLVERKFLKGAR
jgi:hypothetical protein